VPDEADHPRSLRFPVISQGAELLVQGYLRYLLSGSFLKKTFNGHFSHYPATKWHC
jgi:hypothetical protein